MPLVPTTPSTPDLAVTPAVVELVDQSDRVVWRGAWPTELPQASTTIHVPADSALASGLEGDYYVAGLTRWRVTPASATGVAQVVAQFSVYIP